MSANSRKNIPNKILVDRFLFTSKLTCFYGNFGRQKDFVNGAVKDSLAKWLSVRLRTKWFWVRNAYVT